MKTCFFTNTPGQFSDRNGICILLCFAFYYWIQLWRTSPFIIRSHTLSIVVFVDSLTVRLIFFHLWVDSYLHICLCTRVEQTIKSALWRLNIDWICDADICNSVFPCQKRIFQISATTFCRSAAVISVIHVLPRTNDAIRVYGVSRYR